MNTHYKAAHDRAEKSRAVAAQTLASYFEKPQPVDTGTPGLQAQWDAWDAQHTRIIALLQAQAQIDILHVLSHDLTCISDAILTRD